MLFDKFNNYSLYYMTTEVLYEINIKKYIKLIN